MSDVLIAGAGGYIGSRLVPELVAAGYAVRAGFRDPRAARRFAWHTDVEVVRLDVREPALLAAAVRDVRSVYYLVHAMADRDYERLDRLAAQAVARAAGEAEVDRLVYLSGLIPADRGRLSQHLRSRLEVEEILAGGAARTTTLRAGIVIGSGSTSFEMLRQTAELLPILPVSSAMRSQIQPIAVRDAVACLLGCLRPGAPIGPVDIGGPEVVSYAELLRLFTVEAGLLRPRIPLPLVPTAVAARIAPLFSDVPSSLVEALMLSLKHDLVCAPDSPMGRLLPSGYRLLGVRDAIRAALHESPRLAGAAAPLPGDPAWAHGEVYVDDLGVRRRRPRRVWGVNLQLPVRS